MFWIHKFFINQILLIMKYSLIILISVFALGFNTKAQVESFILEPEYSSSSYAKMAMMEEEHDFGKIEQGIPISHTFKFENKGDAPLIISNVKTSCGCTASEYSKEEILPGEMGYLKATYNASKTGHFNKSLTVSSNGGDVVLSIKGEVY